MLTLWRNTTERLLKTLQVGSGTTTENCSELGGRRPALCQYYLPQLGQTSKMHQKINPKIGEID